ERAIASYAAAASARIEARSTPFLPLAQAAMPLAFFSASWAIFPGRSDAAGFTFPAAGAALVLAPSPEGGGAFSPVWAVALTHRNSIASTNHVCLALFSIGFIGSSP